MSELPSKVQYELTLIKHPDKGLTPDRIDLLQEILVRYKGDINKVGKRKREDGVNELIVQISVDNDVYENGLLEELRKPFDQGGPGVADIWPIETSARAAV